MSAACLLALLPLVMALGWLVGIWLDGTRIGTAVGDFFCGPEDGYLFTHRLSCPAHGADHYEGDEIPVGCRCLGAG